MRFTQEQADLQNRKFDANGKTVRVGVGQLQPQIPKQKERGTLDSATSRQQKSRNCVAFGGPFVRVTLVNFRRRILDDDNYRAGCKGLRDAIARWLGLDDNEKFIKWNYAQVQTDGEIGMAVKIERIE